MIFFASDIGEAWDEPRQLEDLAERATRAAVAHSDFAKLTDGATVVEISVKLADDALVQALNADYRGKDYATNVLSFPMIEGNLEDALGRAEGFVMLGDIILAHGVCAREAAEKGVAIETHAAHLIVHGTLHLLGYDHETSDRDAAKMEEIEQRALAALGIADPYRVKEVQP